MATGNRLIVVDRQQSCCQARRTRACRTAAATQRRTFRRDCMAMTLLFLQSVVITCLLSLFPAQAQNFSASQSAAIQNFPAVARPCDFAVNSAASNTRKAPGAF